MGKDQAAGAADSARAVIVSTLALASPRTTIVSSAVVGAAGECVGRLVEELAIIVQPKIVVVMGEPALRILNGFAAPAREIQPTEGEIQGFVPTIDALYVPDSTNPRTMGRQLAAGRRLQEPPAPVSVGHSSVHARK